MNTTVIIGHPYEKSFNHAILQQLKQTTNVTVIDLIADQFNPAMLGADLAGFAKGQSADPLVKKYQTILAETDTLVLVFPIWWYQLPAIYKGFFDKVFLKGFAYTEQKGTLKGELTHIKQTLLISTSEAPKWYLRFFGGNPIKHLQKRVFKDVGLVNSEWLHLGKIKQTSVETRADFLATIKQKINSYKTK